MKKIIQEIKRKDNIIVFIVFFLITLGISLNIYLESSDEIWNFQNVYKMYNGFKIYEEINIIITPFFFWVSKAIFHILGANLCVFRISHCVMMSILFLYTYKILKKLNVPKAFSLLTVLMLLLQEFFLLIRTSFNYNCMALLFFVIGVYYLINEKTRKNVVIQAIITILIVLTKQNIGFYYLIGSMIYIIITQNTLKEKISKILKYVTIIFIGGMIFVLWLIRNNNLLNFLSYTIGGILEFANENLIMDMSGILFMVAIIVINLGMNIFFIKKRLFSDKEKENMKILFIFSLMLSILCYPIFNWTHIVMGTYVSIINIVYIIYLLLKDFEVKLQKILKTADIFIIFVMVIFSIFNIYTWVYRITNDDYPYSWEEPFFGGMMGKEEYEENEKVIQYIEQNEKNVIVFSHRAALYMVPLKRNNGDFDLPFKGNFGFKGEEGLIEKIDEAVDTQFLLLKNEEVDERIYQESTKINGYIKNTKQYMGEIENFEIYE